MAWSRGRATSQRTIVAVLVALAAILVVASANHEGDASPRGTSTTSGSGTTPSGSGTAEPTPPATIGDPPAPTAPPADQVPGALVDTLVVAEPDAGLSRYVRDRFGDDWNYDPTTGCNTRERVLIAESLVPAVVDDRCRPTGSWVSAYDGVATTDIADLQIDHLVPLAEAWRSGAASWTDERRLAFANDLTRPGTLIAVTGRTNQSKSDSSPDQWLPPARTAWCTYATDWVTVKATWQLTVTPAEKATLVQVLAGC